jgi:hypothetical protein
MRVARRSLRRPVLVAFTRRAVATAGLAGLAVTGVTAVPAILPAAAAPGPSGSAGPSGPPGSTRSAQQVPAGAQFVNSPRGVPASGGATQVCPTPARPGQMACMALVPSHPASEAGGAAPDAGPPSGAYAPADLLSAYDLAAAAASVPDGAAGARTVAVVDAFNDPRAAHDLARYRARYGLPRCATRGSSPCLRIVNASGGSRLPGIDQSGDWEFEESVDVDMVSAICPRCHILLVEANSDSITDLVAAEGYASGHAGAVSNSWGSGAEFTGENAFDSRFDRPGVAIVAAAGDSGYGTQYPAASQFVTAAGGTTLIGATATSRGTQTAWSGTGSGCSSLEPEPAWQSGIVPGGCQNRTETDVSAVADPGTPVAIYDTAAATVPGISSGWNEAGGTSVATPIVAAAYALAGKPAAGTYPASYPYLNRAGFTDVTSGSNGNCEAGRRYLCRAGPGYDGPTGLGTPDGTGGFAAPSSAVTVTDPGTQDMARGSRVGLRIAAVTTSGTGLAFASTGLPAGLRLGRSDGRISGRPAAAGTFTVTVTATGSGAGSGSVTFTIVVVPKIADQHPGTGPVRLAAGGECLAVAGGRARAGARAEIRRCGGGGPQDWRYVPGAEPGAAGSLKLRGHCLGIAATRRGAPARLQSCTGSASQRWRYRPGDQLYNPRSGKCLADPGKNEKNGTQVVISSCSASAGESWALPASQVLSGIAGRCLTDPGRSGAPGTRIVLSPCRGGGAQRWAMAGNTTLRIHAECLAVSGGSRQDGAVVDLARCSGAGSERWLPGPGGELLNGRSGRCLADPGNSSAAGTTLVQEDCYGQRGEIWAVS